MSEGTAAGPAPTTATPAAEAPWYGTTIDPELKGWVDNKNFKDPVSALKSYKHAETLLGVPAELRLTLPKDQAAPGAMDPIFNRLGRPETPDKYSFKNLDAGPDGKPLDHELDAWARKTLHPLGLTQAQAGGAYEAIKALMVEAVETETKEAELAVQAGIDGLKKEWGSEFDARAKVATEAIDKLGLTPETVAKLRDLVGHADIAKLFHAIGTKITDPKFVTGDTPTPAPAMTVEGAMAKRAALMEDREFIRKATSGDVEANAQITALAKIIAGGR